MSPMYWISFLSDGTGLTINVIENICPTLSIANVDRSALITLSFPVLKNYSRK